MDDDSPYWVGNNLTITSAASGATSNIVYFNQDGTVEPLRFQPTQRDETEIEWLRRRVDEICWREAA